ncbi:mitochondrial dicarboxylate carrier [Pantherophis guttatus]|uniref:Mitochondrial dicarboxylate carrier n=1 Tax=Pantherophis guttatus TaxID=94885 RepID=A0A6P9BFF5_PANGU|nr:mitochondrial dicarboxylate carrier [Pantherophis guttatus]
MCIGKSALRLGENVFGAALDFNANPRNSSPSREREARSGTRTARETPGPSCKLRTFGLPVALLSSPSSSVAHGVARLRPPHSGVQSRGWACRIRKKEGGEGSAKASLASRMAEKRVSRWYFGGLASCGAACCTHPLDLLKVHLQTQQEVKMRMTGMALRVIRNDGFLALYNGLSASLCRQMTYSLTRFAIYETVRDSLSQGAQGPLPFYQKVLLGAVGGFTGGFVGTPADMVNVRMQNDIKQPAHLRRNYSHALDGLYRVFREEGVRKLFSGGTMASSRGALVTVGQLACYDQAKQLVLGTGLLTDNIFTHFLASFIAGGCATFLCQPLDVLKTRLMNSQGEYRGVMHCAVETAKLGPLAFYKGLVPAGIRLVPHTVLTFVFLEQLRKYFGIKVLT